MLSALANGVKGGKWFQSDGQGVGTGDAGAGLDESPSQQRCSRCGWDRENVKRFAAKADVYLRSCRRRCGRYAYRSAGRPTGVAVMADCVLVPAFRRARIALDAASVQDAVGDAGSPGKASSSSATGSRPAGVMCARRAWPSSRTRIREKTRASAGDSLETHDRRPQPGRSGAGSATSSTPIARPQSVDGLVRRRLTILRKQRTSGALA